MENNFTQSLLITYNGGSLSKERVAQVVEHYTDQLKDGHLNVLDALAQLEWLSQVVDKIKENARQLAVDEIERYGNEAKTGVTIHGVTLKLKEAGVKYTYNHNPLWNTIKEKEDVIAQQRKDLEAMLKTINKPTSFINQETGEVHDVRPALKSSTTTIEIKLSSTK
jgi:hypothetical protein